MKMNLGTRAVLLVAFVLAATCAIINPQAFGGAAQPQTQAAFTPVPLGLR